MHRVSIAAFFLACLILPIPGGQLPRAEAVSLKSLKHR
jgi:hypothetical protein